MLQRFLEITLVPLFRTLMGVFFRSIEITGTENVPPDAPVIYTPNHMNSLVDGILARTHLPRDPGPLAAIKLWKVKALRPFLTAIRAIPVYRQEDSDDEERAEKNQDMFSACYDSLERKYCIVVFPEGESNASPALLKLRTGVARIALGAEEQRGPLGVRIIPVGFNFDEKQRFRSRVLITIGKPIDPVEKLAEISAQDRDAVNKLMERVEEGIKAVTLTYPSWEEAKLVQRAAALYAANAKPDPQDESSLADEFSVQKRVADAYHRAQQSNPRRIERVVNALSSYDRLLRVLSVQHEHVIGNNPKLLEAVFSLRKLSLFLIRLPLSLIGVFLNVVPFLLVRGLSKLKIREDRQSTAKIFGGLIIYPLCWTIQANLMGDETFTAFLLWLLAPLSGIPSLLFRERHAQLIEELRTYLKLNSHDDMRQELAERLEAVKLEVAELLAFDIGAPDRKAGSEFNPP